MDEKRKKRIDSEMQKQVYKSIKKNIGDNFEGVLISVSRADVTDDLAEAKIYLSIYTVNKSYNVDTVINFIKNKVKDIREDVAHNIKLRYMPKLIFVKDEGSDNASKVEDILAKIKKQDNK